MRVRPAQRGHVIDDATEIVIEGFPRSGNTFAVAAFEHAQGRPLAIARHLHAPAQVIQGVRRGLPVVLVVRNPLDAVASQVIRHPAITVRAGLREYVSFHQHLMPYVDDLVVAPFEQLVSDFGKIVDAVNDRFGTTFKRFDHSAANVETVFRMVDSMEQADQTRRHLDPAATVARPTPERERLKAAIRDQMRDEEASGPAKRAREVHDLLMSHWSA